MWSKPIKRPNVFIGGEREDVDQSKIKENGAVRTTYKIDERFFEENQCIRLFGKNFVEKNKDKCRMLIAGKEYEVKEMMKKEEFGEYGIKENDGVLEVRLKGKEIYDMSYMFCDCKSLIKVDLSSFNTRDIEDMTNMFFGCESLNKLDLLSFKTQNVKMMACMLYNCRNLIKLDLSSFNTPNLDKIPFMFWGCESLTKLDLSSFDVQNVTDMRGIFTLCKSLIKVNYGRKSFNKFKTESKNLEKSQLSIIEV